MCHLVRVFRMLGLLGGLSVVADLGTGSPMEESLKRCIVATRLARAVGCADNEASDVIYTSLLQHLGCTAYSHELARVWGDDVASVRLALLTDFTDPRDVRRLPVASNPADRSCGRRGPRVVRSSWRSARSRSGRR